MEERRIQRKRQTEKRWKVNKKSKRDERKIKWLKEGKGADWGKREATKKEKKMKETKKNIMKGRENSKQRAVKTLTDLPAFVTIISVPSSLNSSHNGFISRAAPVLSSLGCTGRAHFFLLTAPAVSWTVSVARLTSSAPPAAVFPPGKSRHLSPAVCRHAARNTHTHTLIASSSDDAVLLNDTWIWVSVCVQLVKEPKIFTFKANVLVDLTVRTTIAWQNFCHAQVIHWR